MRLGRILRWTCTAMVVLLSAAYAINIRWGAVRYGSSGSLVYTDLGSVGGGYLWNPQTPSGKSQAGYKVFKRDMPFKWWPLFRRRGEGWWLDLPIWIPLLAFAAPSAVLWMRQMRRVRPGCCACGYSLAGLAAGTCPECGRKWNR